MSGFTQEHAKQIVEIHEIDRTLEDPEEVECLEMGNPSILEAYRALVAFAESGERVCRSTRGIPPTQHPPGDCRELWSRSLRAVDCCSSLRLQRMTTAEQLDPPWPGDADREDLLRHMSAEEIREILADIPELTAVIWAHINAHLANDIPVDDCEFGRRMRQIIQPRIERAVD